MSTNKQWETKKRENPLLAITQPTVIAAATDSAESRAAFRA